MVSCRKTHAAVKADEERLAREKEAQENQEREERRRQFREKLLQQDDDSEGEFDEHAESYVKPVVNGDMVVDIDNECASADSHSEVESEDDEDEELDEDEKLAELEMKEQELREQETLAEKRELEKAIAIDKADSTNNADFAASPQHGIEVSFPASAVSLSENVTMDSPSSLRIDPVGHSSNVGASFRVEETEVSELGTADKVEEKEEKVKKSKNSKYLKMLMDDSKKKTAPSEVSKLFDEEAEEEEEEGLQRGLLDFGFGKTSDKLDEKEEAVCM